MSSEADKDTDVRELLAEKTGESQGLVDGCADNTLQIEERKSPTALNVDRWGLRRGREVAKEWADDKLGTIDPLLAADAVSSLFEPEPMLAENPEDKHRSAWFKQLMETPEYKNLHTQTMFDPICSYFGSKNLCDQWVEYKKTIKPGAGGTPGGEGESIGDSMGRIRSTTEALKKATKEVDDVKDMMSGLGVGSDPSAEGAVLDMKKIAGYFKTVKKNDLLRKIMSWAGSGRRLCKSIQRRKTIVTRGELTGIEMGGDIARLLPYESVQIAGAIPELETLALYRLAMKRSMCYRHRRNDPKTAGPICILIDESGSMSGDRIIAAKGIALTMAWLAQEQNRWFALVSFYAGTAGMYKLFPPKHKNQDELLAWMSHFFNGGSTDFVMPLHTLPFVYWPKFIEKGLQRGKTDVIVITDACVEESDSGMMKKYQEWSKKEQVRTFGIAVGVSDAGELKKFCTRHWAIPDLTLGSAPVDEIFAI